MANGQTREALASIQLGGKNPAVEMNEEMIRLNSKKGNKMPLKAGASEHNHSN